MFTSLAAAAQADGREAFVKLRELRGSSEDPQSKQAAATVQGIEDLYRDRGTISFGSKELQDLFQENASRASPSGALIDRPADEYTLDELRRQLRIASPRMRQPIVWFLARRPDIPVRDRLAFLMDVIHKDERA